MRKTIATILLMLTLTAAAFADIFYLKVKTDGKWQTTSISEQAFSMLSKTAIEATVSSKSGTFHSSGRGDIDYTGSYQFELPTKSEDERIRIIRYVTGSNEWVKPDKPIN